MEASKRWIAAALLLLLAASDVTSIDSRPAQLESSVAELGEATQEGAGATKWAPGMPRADYIGTDAATISWPAPVVQLLGKVEARNITGYSVVATQGSLKLPVVQTKGSTALSAKLMNLSPKTKYAVTVLTKLSSGSKTGGGPSISFQTKADVPGVVEKPVVSSLSQTSLTLRWKPPATNGGSPIKYYKLGMQSGGSSHSDFAPIVLNGIVLEHTENARTSMLINGLEPGTKYSFNVQAVNAVGDGPVGPGSDQITTLATDVPGPPGKPALSEVTASGLTLTWRPARDFGVPIYAYQILMKKKSDAEFFQYKDLVPVRDLEHVNAMLSHRISLPRGTAAQFKICAVSKKGFGKPGLATAVTLLSSAPDQPGVPVVHNVTSTSARLVWATPKNNGAKITGYRILMQQGANGGFFELARIKGPVTKFDVAGLEYGGHAYQFKVQAISTAGMSEASPSSPTIATLPDSAQETKQQILDEYSKEHFSEVRDQMEKYKFDLAQAKMEQAKARAVAKNEKAKAKKAAYLENKVRTEKRLAIAELTGQLTVQKNEGLAERAMDAKAAEQRLQAETVLFNAKLKRQTSETDRIRTELSKQTEKLGEVEQERGQAWERIRQMKMEGCKRGIRSWCQYQPA